MSELVVHVCKESITFARDGETVGIMPLEVLHVEGLALFKKQNYERMGTLFHQMYLEGVYAGLTMAFGPPNLQLAEIDSTEASQPDPPASDLDLYVAAHPHKFGPDGEFVNDSPKALQTIDPSEVGTVEDVLLEPGPETPTATANGLPAATTADVATATATEAPAKP